MPLALRANVQLVAVAVIIAAGHICAQPAHTHSHSPRAPHVHDAASSDHDEPDVEHHHAPSDEHLDSCEGLRSGHSKLLLVPAMMPAPVAPVIDHGVRRSPETPRARGLDRPLFLLHAALLI